MVLINSTTMHATTKIVYYGPGLCGKTTNLQHIHAATAATARGEMVSLETEGDRTLFFDLLPLEVGVIGGMRVRLQLYTVPGQVFYNATRKLVLKGADGIVFVADSQPGAEEANLASLANLEENLSDLGQPLAEMPLVFQYNKRDLRQLLPLARLEERLNRGGAPFVEASALHGVGVFETLKEISRLTLATVRRRIANDGRSPLIAVPAAPRAAEAGAAPAAGPHASSESDEARTGPLAVPEAPVEADPAPVPAGPTVVEQHARGTLELPSELLAGSTKLGVHLSFQGNEVRLRDALTLPLPSRDGVERIVLKLELELVPTTEKPQ
jgi:signal recognition particle receptor subunit beta